MQGGQVMQVHRETLEEEATHVTDEARMVLPLSLIHISEPTRPY